ncbi:hypothetical protein ABZP12_03144 [Xanthomonas euvesicatoria]
MYDTLMSNAWAYSIWLMLISKISVRPDLVLLREYFNPKGLYPFPPRYAFIILLCYKKFSLALL